MWEVSWLAQEMFLYPYYTRPVVSLNVYSIPCLASQDCPLLTTLEQVALRCGGLTQGGLFLFFDWHAGIHEEQCSGMCTVQRSVLLQACHTNLVDAHYNQNGWWRNSSSYSCLMPLNPLLSAVLLYITVTGILCSWQLTREIFLLVSERTV